MKRKLKIAVLFGGCSPEHDVSLQSASAIIRHMDAERFAPIPIGITRQGEWYRFCGDIGEIAAGTWYKPAECRVYGQAPGPPDCSRGIPAPAGLSRGQRQGATGKKKPSPDHREWKKGRDKTTSARTVYHRRTPRVKRGLHKNEESFGPRACRSLSPLPRASAGKKNPEKQPALLEKTLGNYGNSGFDSGCRSHSQPCFFNFGAGI